MRLLKKSTIILIGIILSLNYHGHSQLLKKLKDKVNNAINNKTSANNSTNTNPNNSNSSNNTTNNSTNSNSSGSATNTRGGGLTNTAPPDVVQAMTDAEKSQSEKNYSDARYSLQQALMGIELQIGRQVLNSLPPTVTGLDKDTTQNKVTSTQWGWNNLTIQTMYKKADQQMTVTIGNNPWYSGFATMYFNSGYVQSNSEGKQNVKQTRVKGNKAVITYDDSKGYTLLVQLGQSSLISWECVNFATEQDVMNAANAFDIDGIKKTLGEK